MKISFEKMLDEIVEQIVPIILFGGMGLVIVFIVLILVVFSK